MMNKILKSMAAAGTGLLLVAGVAFAATTYSLFGDATIVPLGNPGNAAQIRSDATIPPSFGGVSVVPSAPIPWASLATLSTDFNVTDDNCGGGSPRIQIRVDTNNDGISNGNVHVALGPSPSFTGCTAGWQSTGNLIGNADSGRYDYGQFGGSASTTYSGAPANVLAGNVVGISVVVDGSWSAAATGGDGEQTVLVDNITLNNDVVTFEPNTPKSKDDCKKGGWQDLEDANGDPFKNQGQCVSYFQANENAGKQN